MNDEGSISGLLTDLYELTMAAGYVEAGISEHQATFELTIRRLPACRNYVIAAGLAQVVEYLASARFGDEEIRYLRTLPQLAWASESFFDRLRRFRFRGDLLAMAEGTPVFGGEPILVVRAPLIEAQLAETYLLASIGFQSMVAAKASRVVVAAGGREVVEFGTRRAHSPQAGVLAGRAAYIGGCSGSSNTLAGFLYGIPIYGTMAHSWVLAFADEETAFRRLQGLLGNATIYVVDTYDTLEGVRRAARLGKPMWGIRLDSGDLAELSKQARVILDSAGLSEVKIIATGDLNEYKIRDLVAAGAPIDVFGVGTELATSADAPNLGVVYKMVELESEGTRRHTAKLSEDKTTYPGAKQVYRFRDHDEIVCAWECRPPETAQALLRPVLSGGNLVEALPDATTIRSSAAKALEELPAACRRLDSPEPYRIDYSPALLGVADEARKRVEQGR